MELFKSCSDKLEKELVNKVLDRGTFWANGPEIKEFEDALAKFHNKKYAIAFNSGTSALYANLLAHNITLGEVIVPSFTFPATANSVILAGAKPVFADIEKETLGLDVSDVEKRITKNTKAIMPIHFAGGVAKDINYLSKLADAHDIYLIEDNAQSLGATLDGQLAGTFGDSSITSFCFNKVLTTGEGGMVFTDSKEIAKRLRLFRSHGRNEKKDYVIAGMNLRMPTICAAIGLAQFKKLKEIIKGRRAMAKLYNIALNDFKNVNPLNYNKNNKSVYCSYNILFNNQKERDDCMSFLNKIPTRVSYPPVHLYSFFKKYKSHLPVTEDISKRILTIPLHLGLKIDDLLNILSVIKKWNKQLGNKK